MQLALQPLDNEVSVLVGLWPPEAASVMELDQSWGTVTRRCLGLGQMDPAVGSASEPAWTDPARGQTCCGVIGSLSGSPGL